MYHIAFIIHGKLKNKQRLTSSISELFGLSAQIEFFYTEYVGHATELSRTAAQKGFTHFICVGGDGSLNETTNGLMQAKSVEPRGSKSASWRLGLIPAGTGNDFARTLNITAQLSELKECIDNDYYKEIDLGLADFLNPSGSPSRRWFINITDVGLGGTVSSKLSSSSRLFGSFLTYQSIIISSLLTYRPQIVKASIADFVYQGKIMNLIVANGKYFGGGMGIAPGASVTDKLFSIVIVGDISLADYLSNLGDIRKCKKVRHPKVQYLNGASVSVETLGGPLPIDMDGEFIGYAPLKIQLVTAAIKFLCMP